VRNEGAAHFRLRANAPGATAGRKARCSGNPFLNCGMEQRDNARQMQIDREFLNRRARRERRKNSVCNASVTAGRARTPCAPRQAEDCPPCLFSLRHRGITSVSSVSVLHPRANSPSLVRGRPQPAQRRTQDVAPANSSYFHLIPLNSTSFHLIPLPAPPGGRPRRAGDIFRSSNSRPLRQFADQNNPFSALPAAIPIKVD